MDLEPYDARLAPDAFGLANTGSSCYFNSFLQAIAGCTSLARAAYCNVPYLQATATGGAVFEFFRQIPGPSGDPPTEDVASFSWKILDALAGDLKARRGCGVKALFGRSGQDDALIAIPQFFDMMEPPSGPDEIKSTGGDSPRFLQSEESPITRLLTSRYREVLYCRRCRRVVSTGTADTNVYIELDRNLGPKAPRPADVASFARAILRFVRPAPDYECPGCHQRGHAFHLYRLTLAPEILICGFGICIEHGGERRPRFTPERFALPAPTRGSLVYRLVGQVEKLGSQHGGHYVARGLRADGNVYLFDDMGVSPSAFAPTSDTYFVVYHYEGESDEPAGV